MKSNKLKSLKVAKSEDEMFGDEDDCLHRGNGVGLGDCGGGDGGAVCDGGVEGDGVCDVCVGAGGGEGGAEGDGKGGIIDFVDRLTDRVTDIGDCRVVFAVENK